MGDEVVEVSFGKFLVNPLDLIGSTLKAGTVWDGPGFLQPIAVEHGRLGESGTTILDVGANIGVWTVWLARMGAWRVVACEPIPETRKYLRANLDLNKDVCAERVIVIETAAYSQATTLYLQQPYAADNMGSTELAEKPRGFAQEVEALPLDAYKPLFGQRVSLIKIDTQGCDGRVLRGLEETIRAWHPAIVFEWEAESAARHGDSFEDTVRWLRLQGYATLAWPSQPNNYLATWQGGR